MKVLLFFLFFSFISRASDIDKYNLSKMQKAYQQIKELKSYPVVADYHWVNTTDYPLQPEIIDAFSKMQLTVFGAEELELLNCTDEAAFLGEKKLCISAEYIKYIQVHYGKRSGMQVAYFILAHELAHYLQGLYIKKLSSDGLSVNGFPGLEGLINPDLSIDLYHYSHAELDFFAFYILKDSGFSYPKKAARYARDFFDCSPTSERICPNLKLTRDLRVHIIKKAKSFF